MDDLLLQEILHNVQHLSEASKEQIIPLLAQKLNLSLATIPLDVVSKQAFTTLLTWTSVRLNAWISGDDGSGE